MNKFLNTITGFSLLIGSVSFSQDKFTAFYPEENNDSPIYIKNFEKTNKEYHNSFWCRIYHKLQRTFLHK